MRSLWLQVFMAVLVSVAHAEIKLEPVEYKQGDTTLRGQIAYDASVKGKRPGVLIVHEWWGLNDYAKMRAKMLAEAGYVAFAVDMYGDGKSTEHPEDAGAWATAVRSNEKVGEERFLAAYTLLKANPRVDAAHISAIGYCFGGGVVLNMAFAGTDLDGVVSFHGVLPQAAPAGKIVASILACNGAADDFIPADQVQTFQKNLAAAGADWEFIEYGSAKHSFTNPGADKYGMPALAYNAKADKRSWATALEFLAEVSK